MKVTRTASDGTTRFSVPIRIGHSAPIDAFLDTGSSGLRILAGAVADSEFSCASPAQVTYSFHSGLSIQGIATEASVTIGSLTTPNPIPVMLIEEVGCTAEKPNCNAKGQTPESYTLFGPYKAILGVGMRNNATAQAIGNPIAQLAGQPSFIVSAPSYGGTNGTLIIGPTAAQTALFSTYQLPPFMEGAPLANGTPTWDDRFGLPACLSDQTTGIDYCVPAELDSGNPPTYIEWPADKSGTSTLPSGDHIDVAIGPKDALLGEYTFTIASTPTPGIDEVEVEPATAAGFMNLGTAVFFHDDVYLDQAHGIIGLATH